MMSRIDRIRRAVSSQRAARTEGDPPKRGGESGTALVPAGPVITPRSIRDGARPGDSGFEAQLLGQDGERRGLRAGPSLVDRAQSAYNRIEWSGAYDRRARKGRATRTDI